MAKRPITPTYVIFYILFLPDSWRIAIGLLVAVLAAPYVIKPDMETAARAVIFLMMATIGYAASGIPARWITGKLKKWILGDRYR